MCGPARQCSRIRCRIAGSIGSHSSLPPRAGDPPMSSGSQTAGAAATNVDAPDPGRWKSLAVILSAAFLVGLDFFIVNVSIPSIRADLHATFAEVQLVIASYGLTYAVLLISGGRLGDIYGRRRMFIW